MEAKGVSDLLKAMSCRCAIVATDHGGIKDIVSEECGIFVEKNSPSSVAEGIENAMMNFSTRSEVAWKVASSKYKMSDFVERVEKALKRVRKEV